MPELLLEVGCEELPSSACREIIEQAPGITEAALDAFGLDRDEVRVWVAPRRLAVSVTGLPERQSGEARSVAGPPEAAAFDASGAPTKAAEGFARKQGVGVGDLVVREGRDGRRVVFAEIPGESREVADLVPDLARRLLDGIRFSKTMRWGDGAGLRFSRPVRWIVAKLDERTVPFELYGLTAGDVSMGHRFIGGPVTIAAGGDYREALRGVGVVADHAERRATITAALDAAAAEMECRWSDPLGKLEEVVHLVEWPSVIAGRIEQAHLRLPPKVLVTAMQSHQRYFPLERADGALHPAFLAVSNGDPAHAALITRGNEGVLDARLQDAAFSFDKDTAAGLDALDAKLGTIVFHQRLGTLADKRDRLVATAGRLATVLGRDAAAATAMRAAELAKADQGSVLVAEFPDLQGYAGSHYASLAGEDREVVAALAEQYLPEGPDSPTPETAPGALLALAEKVDNLVGAFAIEERPSSSKDPYGLRRAAAGLVRIVLERGWDLRPADAFGASFDLFAQQGAQLGADRAETLGALHAFVADRLSFHLEGEGVGSEAATAALRAEVGGLAATADWARAIQRARDTEPFHVAWEACNRCVRIAAKGPDADGPWAPAGDAGEDALAGAVREAGPRIDAARAAGDFEAALSAGAALGPPVDRFFTDVLVNAPDPIARARRYALVRQTAEALGRIADFTVITQGGTR